jgi:hypothetical protein
MSRGQIEVTGGFADEMTGGGLTRQAEFVGLPTYLSAAASIGVQQILTIRSIFLVVANLTIPRYWAGRFTD